MSNIVHFTSVRQRIQSWCFFHQPENGWEAVKGAIFMECLFQEWCRDRGKKDIRSEREFFEIGMSLWVGSAVRKILDHIRSE